jgi:16S rRNA (cytidine1402-2'-O)-methyltransferase
LPPGTLFLVATPIGNLADITLRALETLRTVNWIAAEDTRHTRKLLSHYGISKPLVSYRSDNAAVRGPEMVRRLVAGEQGALVADAGTPGISDPGALLISQAVEASVPVVVIPGPTAFLTALISSGLGPQPFAFLGFPPSRGSGRRRFFADHGLVPMTLVLYEAPHRLLKTLTHIREHWGDRCIAVARELTKVHEEIFRGRVTQALERFAGGVRGEITLVVAGAEPMGSPTGQTGAWRSELGDLLARSGMTVKTATEAILARHPLPRRLVYQAALKLKASSS